MPGESSSLSRSASRPETSTGTGTPGLTWQPSVDIGDDSVSLESPFVSGSSIYRVLLAHVQPHARSRGGVERRNTGRRHEDAAADSLTLSPGARGGWNLGDHQLILGIAVPTVWTSNERTETALLVYFPTNCPFKR